MYRQRHKRNFRRNSNSRNRRSSNRRRKNHQRNSKIPTHKYISKPKAKSETSNEKIKYTGIKFSEFDLEEKLARNIKQKNYEFTTEIQEKTIPTINDGQDVLGISETGSGKTASFLIPMINQLLKDKSKKLLIIAPTRELAQQTAKEAISLVKGSHIHVSLIIGGENFGRQLSDLRKGYQLIVGTPGRLNDMIKKGFIKPHMIGNIIIDEVDRMLDMGFIDDIKFIFDKLPKDRQSLFFSATHNKQVEKIVSKLSQNYKLVKLANNTPNDSVVQDVVAYSKKEEKISILKNLLSKQSVKKAIIFVETKKFADKVDKILYKSKFRVGVIHGDKRQNQRKRIIQKFRKSKIDYLVATNVAARGIDIDDITHIINLDEPGTYDEYIHRIGRTGRNGSVGKALTFVKK
jgi:superfamily II DNA/RNA helicase